MPKRKLSDLETPQPTKHSKPSIQTTRLTQLFDQGVHTLSRALKTARGFERQKLGKREQKTKAEKNEAALEKVRGEIAVLKTLEYTTTAERYIFKQLLKTKRIAESAAFGEFRQIRNIAPAGPGSAAEANVTARMFKAKPVQSVLPGIMAGFRRVLGIEDRGKVEKKGGEGDGVKEKTKNGKVDERKVHSKQDEESAEEEAEDEDAESVDFSHFDSRLAPGSDESADEGEDGEDGGEEASDSNDNDISPSRSPSPPPKKPKPSNSKPQPTTSTTFLPSLSMGGYFSGSESEPEDGEAAPPQRKNRMGQQARRALWEKKYGAKANHVKSAKKEEKRSRDSGWDLRRGATDGSERRGRGMGRGGHRGAGDSKRNGGGGKPGPVQDDKPLHPSWEAAKKAKEQKATAAFQGKKVVFD